MTIKYTDLKFPVGEFSHTELAAFNGLDRKKVWTAYQTTIAEGIIKSSGNERKSGKGKAAALWVVADPTKVTMSTESVPVMVPATAPVVNVEPELVPAKPKKQKKEKPAEVPIVVAPADKPFETELPVVQPAVAPVVSVSVSVVEVLTPAPVVETTTQAENITTLGEMTQIEDKCPFCKGNLVSAPVNGGVRVWCPVNNPSICSCSENPYGYSNNIANAVKILNDKFCRVSNEA